MSESRFDKFTADLRNAIADMPESPLMHALSRLHQAVMADHPIIQGKEPDAAKRLQSTIDVTTALLAALTEAQTADVVSTSPGRAHFEALLTELFALLGATKKA